MQLALEFEDLIPIPECRELMELTKHKRPIDLANEMVREARLWQEKYPDKNVMEIVTPEWQEYIKSRL